jgi:hypothetical protein
LAIWCPSLQRVQASAGGFFLPSLVSACWRFGLVGLAVYLRISGGLYYVITHASQLRESGSTPAGLASGFSFTKRLVPFLLPATVFLTIAWSASRARWLVIITAVSWVCTIAACLLLFGRLVVVAFALPFLMPPLMRSARGFVYFLLGGGAATLLIAFYGKWLQGASAGFDPYFERSMLRYLGKAAVELAFRS